MIIILPKFHSVIDLITNSSTELFISKQMTIESVVEILNNISTEDIGIGDIEEITKDNIEEFFNKVWMNYCRYVVDDLFIPSHFIIKDYYEFLDLNNSERYFRYYNNAEVKEKWNSFYNEYLEDWKKSYWEHFNNFFIGRILVSSKSDNSIPYEYFDVIAEQLNAFSIHIS